MIRTVIVVTLSAALAACSLNSPKDRGKRNEQALGTQQMLAESGFVESMLDTPEKVAEVRDLPQRQVIRRGTASAARYIYVDTALCGCMYSGDASAYERYRQRLGRQATRVNNYQAQQIQSGNQKIIRPIGRYD
jgi:hypothetical protein